MVKNDIAGMMKDKLQGKYTKIALAEVITAFEESVIEAVADGEEVNLAGFMKIGSKDVPARVVRNPKTGETIDKPAGRKVVIKSLKNLKDCVE